jgi:ribonuclease-3
VSSAEAAAIDKRRLIGRLGYPFKDLSLVDLALSHRSIGARNNERLEFLGDSIVGYLMAEALFEKFPDCREGELSQMRSQLVKGATLAEIAKEFDLGDFLHLGPGELKSGGHRRESILADAVEALIAAIYQDAGANMDVCRQYVLPWFQSRLDAISPKNANKDAKTLLQEWLQGNQRPLPKYHLRETTGSDHQQEFAIECEIAHIHQRFEGKGTSRRVAEQAAAAIALQHLQQ